MLLLRLHPLVLQHARILPHILALDLQPRLGLHSLDQKVVVAVRAVFVALVKLGHVFAEALFAFLAREDHLGGLFEVVGLGVGVALRAVEPLAAAGGADGDLGVEDVLAGGIG